MFRKINTSNRFLAFSLAIAMISMGSCVTDENEVPKEEEELEDDRWVTLVGAFMGDAPGDGNGGTNIYAISYEDAIDPDKEFNVFDDGTPVKSNRTARLQVSEDGGTLFNIAYSGENGGEYAKFDIRGGSNYVQEDVTVNISQYAGTSPRWSKLYNGDKNGIAVNVANIVANNAEDATADFQYYRGTATVLDLDLQETLISNYKTYELPLSAEEELAGHTIFRLDAPVLNQAGDKLLIGTWMRKYDPATGLTESDFDRLGTKTVVVDYPSLENPTIITSTQADGDCSGYRSNVNQLADDGYIYQATTRNSNGSHILRIGSNNEYDNTYALSLDVALGLTDTYVDAWKYVSNGIGYALIRHGEEDQGYVVRMDLKQKTASIVQGVPNDPDVRFNQFQGFLVSGDDLLLPISPLGQDGNIYILHSQTNEVSIGAKIINKPGNHFIGVF
ncbi:hypothetical protein CA2015_0528 [Cyclobacterium amurskyense]|uniref:DUF4374 domain-containing protein n=2 Tax=Cyclobacterium amurskyense TaxID=320787 RepID=A0A0H4PA46_9BACT|nr:hypothetical protein CA2015_0528 [Cyclobacterium amurskyense]|tara:strand:+ start:18309 stop:19646 length:1338 start_codon:yes stop_codon:yes gene_type:complete